MPVGVLCPFFVVPCVGLQCVVLTFLGYNHLLFGLFESIRIYHECEGGIEKFVPGFTDWHHEACRVMTNGDRKGWIFLSHPHKNNGFFLLTTKYLNLFWKNMKKASSKNPEYAEMRQGDVILTFQ